MAVNDSQLVQLFEQVLTLSKVDASQSVAGDPEKSLFRCAHGTRSYRCCITLGAKVYTVELPSLLHPRAMGNDMTAYCW